MDKDYGATQAVKKYAPGLAWLLPFRNVLTPAALWGAIVVLAAGITYVVTALNDIHHHQESITDLQRERSEDRELLQSINTQLAVMNSKVGNIATEVDHEREWRTHIEEAAESAPHARHR